MTANETLVAEIVDMNFGFDIEEIQSALIATGNKSSQDAIEYLINQKTAESNNNISNDIITASDIETLKKKLQNLDLANVTSQIMEEALKKNHNNKDTAVQWILDKYSPQKSHNNINNNKRNSQSKPSMQQQQQQQQQPTSQTRRTSKTDTQQQQSSSSTVSNLNVRDFQDADAYKKLMKEEAEMKKNKQMEEEKQRQLQLQQEAEESKRQEEIKEQQKIEREKRVEDNRRKLEEKKETTRKRS